MLEGMKMQKYRILGKKGEGTFSVVLKCQSVADGRLFACKRMKQRFESMDKVNNLREIQAMRRLNPHANIVSLQEVIFDKKSATLALICELLDMNLYEAIKGKTQLLPETKCRSYIYQVLKGLEHMHRNGIFHRDIKPENILLKGDVVKLADFGSCRSVYSKQPFTEYISTRWYRAPECLLTDGYYSYKMDVWSVGCVFFEILTLRPLFPGSNEVDQIAKIHEALGSPPAEWLSKLKKSRHMSFDFPKTEGSGIKPRLTHVSSQGTDAIEKLCKYDPEERCSARQMLRHAYFKQLRDRDKRLAAATRASMLSQCTTINDDSDSNNNSNGLQQKKDIAKYSFSQAGSPHAIVKSTSKTKQKIQLPNITALPQLTKIPIATRNTTNRSVTYGNHNNVSKNESNSGQVFPTFQSIIQREKQKLKSKGQQPQHTSTYGRYNLPAISSLRHK